MAQNKDIMNNNIPDFSGFPTDNSSSTNLKYDIIASKFMTGIRNHEKRSAPTQSAGVVIYLIGAVLELVVATILILCIGIKYVFKKLLR